MHVYSKFFSFVAFFLFFFYFIVSSCLRHFDNEITHQFTQKHASEQKMHLNCFSLGKMLINEQRREKTGVLPMGKQRRRSAVQ